MRDAQEPVEMQVVQGAGGGLREDPPIVRGALLAEACRELLRMGGAALAHEGEHIGREPRRAMRAPDRRINSRGS